MMDTSDKESKQAHYNLKSSKERAQLAQPQVVAAREKQQAILRKMRDELLMEYTRINLNAIDASN